MLVKMNVAGRGQDFTVDTITGICTGKTYYAKDFLKENFDAKWNKEEKIWTVDVEKFNQELSKYADYYKKYIVEKIETEEDKVEVESTEESAEENEEVETTVETTKNEKTIARKELVNGNDGFYMHITYTDGTHKNVFCG